MGAPSGTVTFLFTDIEGSTRLWEEHPDAMRVALARHDDLVREAVGAHAGYVFSWAGDGIAAAFQRSVDAAAAAVAAQVAFGGEVWPQGAVLRVRMALHSGEAEERDENYFGSPVNRAARLMGAARGGQVVVSELTAGLLAATPGIGLVDLGVHRLRGLVEPTRVFGLKADGLEWLDLPLVTADASRGNLPRPLTEWFGSLAVVNRRAAELGQRRLVTLTGPGGVGKTRLAIEAAGLVAAEFPDGVWMVELGPLADPEAVWATVASALGVLPQEGVGLIGAIVDWLTDRRLLLVIDNCEHLLGPVSDLVGAVVERCPTVTVVATSREPLGVEGERVATVPSLAELDAVDLFCDRAAAVDESVAFSDGDREVIASICSRLDGIPLAIELAAARTRSLSPADLLERLADRFAILRGSGRGVARHQTLRATVDWSYQLLSDPERLLFDRLSVFAGGFDLPAVEEICAGEGIEQSDVLDLLAALVEKSLVDVQRSGPAVRYRLLETLRQYGEERLEMRGETDLLRQRHLAHYVAVARAASDLWASPRMVEGAAIFTHEWDNVRAAHAAALSRGDLQQAVMLLKATAGHAMYDLRVEYLDWAERTLARCEATGHIDAALYGYAAMAAGKVDNDRAIDLALRGIAATGGDNPTGATLCWAALGDAYLTEGRIDELRGLVAPLVAAVAAARDPVTVFCGYSTLVYIACITDPAAIAAPVRQATTAAEQTGSPALLAHCAYLEGNRLRIAEPHDLEAALACHRRGLALARQAEVRDPMGLLHVAIGGISVQLGLPTAQQSLAEAIAYQHDLRQWGYLWTLLGYAAAHFSETDRPYEAAVLWGYLSAQEPSAVAVLAKSFTFPGLPDLNSTEARQGSTDGEAMDRNQIVAYALSVLSPHDGPAASG
jgi:predicted ATPase/class 3 adenylate cyclase